MAIIAYICVNIFLGGPDEITDQDQAEEINVLNTNAVSFYYLPEDSDECRDEIS